MHQQFSRRQFLATSAAAGVGLAAASRLEAAPFKTKLQKSLIGAPTEQFLTQLKAAGFDGLEVSGKILDPRDPAERAKVAEGRKAAEKAGIRIHSVLRGWMNFNSPDADLVKKEIDMVAGSIEATGAYGATAILLVPCKVDPKKVNVPKAGDFDIEFDAKTGHVKRIVKGDNGPYADYIAAQNLATDASRKAVEQLIPVAEKCKVIIGLENVWNHLWVLPDLTKNFISSFKSPWVQFYFDIGNHVKYAAPEKWIRTLGKLIVRCHVKDFKLDASGHDGKFCPIREGSVNWPEVRKALDEVGYNGFMTIEGGGIPMDEQSRRLDKIIAGE